MDTTIKIALQSNLNWKCCPVNIITKCSYELFSG
jgi:hypothetical protein